MPVCCSCSSSFSMLWTTLPLKILHTSLKWFVCYIIHPSSNMLGTILVFGPECSIHIFFLQAFPQVWLVLSPCWLLSICSIASKFFNSCKLLMTAAWVLCNSTLFALVNTCSFSIIIFPSILVNSLLISALPDLHRCHICQPSIPVTYYF